MTNTDAERRSGTAMLVVAAALIDADGRVLVQRRPSGKAHAGQWEFPGGKVEAGETPEAALARELHEELGILCTAPGAEPLAFASTPLADRQLVLLLYLVRGWTGTPQAHAADALAWHAPADLRALSMPPADRTLTDALVRALPLIP